MNIKVDFDNIIVKEDKNDFNVKVLMLKGEKGDKGDGEANVIEKVQVNGTNLPVTNKTVNVPVPIVDSAISSSSTNPVQNSAIYNALSNKVDNSALDNYYEVSEVDNLLNAKANVSLVNKKTYYFDNVDYMKAYNLSVGDYVFTKGYYNVNDGGSGKYEIVSDSSLVDDGGLIIELNNELKAKLIINDYINVKQFGAKGDGITDDSIPIENALNSGASIFVPSGNYLISKHIDVTNLLSLKGEAGSTFNITKDNDSGSNPDEVNGIMFKNLDGFTIENVIFLDVTTNAGRIGGYNTTFEGCSNLLVNQIEVEGACGFGMLFWKNCHHVKVTNCYIHDIWADGIHFQRGSHDIIVDGCKFENTKDDAIAIVSIDANETWGQCYNAVITNNFIDTTTVTGSGICLDGSKNICCKNNIIKNIYLGGIRVNRIKDDNTSHYNIPTEITIINNYIDTVGVGNVNDSNIDGIDGNVCGTSYIKNNIIKNCLGYGINFSGCLGIYDVYENNISNCQSAIIITSTSNQTYDDKFIVNVKNNNIYEMGKRGFTITAQNTTSISEDNVSVIIDNNLFVDLNTSEGTSGYGIYAPNTKNLKVTNNIFRGTPPYNYYYLDNSVYTFKNNVPTNNTFASQSVGTQTQLFKSSAPAKGSKGDVVWNLNPSTNVLLWVCTTASTDNSNAVYTPVNIN